MATLKKNTEKKQSFNYLYYTNLLEMKVILNMNQIGTTVTKKNLKSSIESSISGKCIEEGYVQPNSIEIKSYSAGNLKSNLIEFNVVFECKTYNPAEGSWISNCKVQSVTKAGIHANTFDRNNNIPATIFVIRDHFSENKYFQEIKEDDLIDIKVIGTRFELNDSFVEVLGALMPKAKE